MQKRRQIAFSEILVILTLIIVCVKIFSDVVGNAIYNIFGSDYDAHIGFAGEILFEHRLPLVHFLFQALTIAVFKLFPITLQNAALVVAVIFYVFTALILYWMLRRVLGAQKWWAYVIAAVAALSLLLVTPITLFTYGNHNLYFGYIANNTLHSPSMVILKPFALLLFLFTVAILQHQIHISPRTILAGVLLVLLSMLAKPNFALILLPALLVVIIYRLYKRETNSLMALVLILVVPIIVLLGIQYAVMYLYIGNNEGGILFAPLGVVRFYERSYLNIAIKFFLSTLFPLAVYALYPRRATRDVSLTFGWLLFICGVLQMYLLAESGERFVHGNFFWSAQIGLFILFVASLVFLLRNFSAKPQWRFWLCLLIFGVHLYSGVLYYHSQLLPGGFFDWW